MSGSRLIGVAGPTTADVAETESLTAVELANATFDAAAGLSEGLAAAESSPSSLVAAAAAAEALALVASQSATATLSTGSAEALHVGEITDATVVSVAAQLPDLGGGVPWMAGDRASRVAARDAISASDRCWAQVVTPVAWEDLTEDEEAFVMYMAMQ